MKPTETPLVRLLRSRVGQGVLAIAKRLPGGRFIFNSTFDPHTGFHIGRGDSCTDWDERARRNARYFIAVDDAATPEAFDQSGDRDLDEIILCNLPVNPNWKALEIGCGIGRLLRPLSLRIAEVHGVDVSEEMIRQGMEYVAGHDNLSLHRTTGSFEMFPDETFDLIYSYRVFQHIPERKVVVRYLHEARRVLKRGGWFRFQIGLSDHANARGETGGTWFGTLFSREEILPLVESCGLNLQSMEIENSLAAQAQSLWNYAMVTCVKQDS